MNLALFHSVLVPARGGCDAYIADLTRRLCADGHQIHLYTSTWDATPLPPELACHEVAVCSWPRFLFPWRFSQACLATARSAGHDLTLAFEQVAGVDVLYPMAGSQIARLELQRQRPASVLRRWLDSFDLNQLAARRFEYQQFATDPVPFLIANSDLVRCQFAEYLKVSPQRIPVLRLAIDGDHFATTDRLARRVMTRQEWRVEPTDTVALCFSRYQGGSGLEPLLRAVSRLENRARFRLMVLEDEPTHPHHRLARRLGVQEWVQFGEHAGDPRNAYFAADLLVQPTLHDPGSLVVQEAMACGLPVITSRFAGAAELLAPPTDGLVLPDPTEVGGLVEALCYFLDPARRQACARAALRGGQRWTFEDHYREFLLLLEEAARRKRAA